MTDMEWKIGIKMGKYQRR